MGTNNSLILYFGEAGIPYSRLHDTGGRFGGGVFVDIANIFRDLILIRRNRFIGGHCFFILKGYEILEK